MRKSDLFLAYLLVHLVLFLALAGHASARRAAALAGLAEKSAMVRDLELTDLCLFTEANYTRHPSQADIHGPFQDHPVSLEHFPSGSLLPPPQMLRRIHEPLG